MTLSALSDSLPKNFELHCINLVENLNFVWLWWWFMLCCKILLQNYFSSTRWGGGGHSFYETISQSSVIFHRLFPSGQNLSNPIMYIHLILAYYPGIYFWSKSLIVGRKALRLSLWRSQLWWLLSKSPSKHLPGIRCTFQLNELCIKNNSCCTHSLFPGKFCLFGEVCVHCKFFSRQAMRRFWGREVHRPSQRVSKLTVKR